MGKLIRHLRRTIGRPLPVYSHRALQPHQPTSCPGERLERHLTPYNQAIAA